MVGGIYINNDNISEIIKIFIQNNIKRYKLQMIIRMGKYDKNNYSTLRDNTLLLMDEFDSLIDPLKSDLNYPYGKQKNLDHQDRIK